MEPTRPRLHFTPRSGGLGDLFGVLATGGRYHVFYEHRPGPAGAAGWGSAISDDLVIWTEQEITESPAGPGCGTVVEGPRGPVLFFTRTGGEIASVGSAPGGWRADLDALVIAGPPPGVTGLRDPYVWQAEDGWRMLLGARLGTGAGAILQYRSADLLNWDYDGVVVTRETTGGLCCPALFRLDGVWVLLVSTLGDQEGDVAYAVGDYDGRAFTARAWDVFARGRLGPAVTFVDAAGRRCALARLGEQAAPPGSLWAGALSLPWILSVRGERLLATPHPHLDRYLINGTAGLTAAGGEVRDHDEVILTMPSGGETLVLTDADIVEVSVEGVSGFGAARRAVPGTAGARIARFSGSPLSSR